jgi:hypothetical protein
VIALTRTCRLADFPDCRTIGDWQAGLVAEAYQRWWPSPELDLHAPHLLVNMSRLPIVLLPEIAPSLRVLTNHAVFMRDVPIEAIASTMALMVLDHIEAPITFLRYAARTLSPGGLFIATAAYWDAEGADATADHAGRRRIYNRISWRKLIVEAGHEGLSPYGGIDWTYHGHVLGDHTLASLVLMKGAPR